MRRERTDKRGKKEDLEEVMKGNAMQKTKIV